MARNSDLSDAILTVVMAGLILSVGLVAANAIVERGGPYPASATVLLDGTGNTVTIDDEVGVDEQVVNSRGLAVSLAGTDDSYVSSSSEFEIADDNTWTIATFARVDSTATASELTAVSANGRVVITLNRTANEWRGWYYNESTRYSHEVSVAAPSPSTFTNVVVWSNGSSLTIYRNNTQGSVADLSVESHTPAPNASNWNGRLDELRTFDTALNATVRGQLHSSPIAAQPGTDRTGRVMFDESDRATQRIFFSSASMETSNVTFTDGLEGTLLVEGTDYRWNSVGPTLTPLAGGALDGAPVAYADYDAKTEEVGSLVPDFTQAVRLAGLALLLVIVGSIVGYLTAVDPR